MGDVWIIVAASGALVVIAAVWWADRRSPSRLLDEQTAADVLGRIVAAHAATGPVRVVAEAGSQMDSPYAVRIKDYISSTRTTRGELDDEPQQRPRLLPVRGIAMWLIADQQLRDTLERTTYRALGAVMDLQREPEPQARLADTLHDWSEYVSEVRIAEICRRWSAPVVAATSDARAQGSIDIRPPEVDTRELDTLLHDARELQLRVLDEFGPGSADANESAAADELPIPGLAGLLGSLFGFWSRNGSPEGVLAAFDAQLERLAPSAPVAEVRRRVNGFRRQARAAGMQLSLDALSAAIESAALLQQRVTKDVADTWQQYLEDLDEEARNLLRDQRTSVSSIVASCAMELERAAVLDLLEAEGLLSRAQQAITSRRIAGRGRMTRMIRRAWMTRAAEVRADGLPTEDLLALVLCAPDLRAPVEAMLEERRVLRTDLLAALDTAMTSARVAAMGERQRLIAGIDHHRRAATAQSAGALAVARAQLQAATAALSALVDPD